MQQSGEDVGGVETALLRGAQDGGEDLLGLRALRRAVAAAAGFAGDDRGTQRVFGAPVRGVEPGIEEEAEDGLEFGFKMGGETARVGEATGSAIQQSGEAVDIRTARDRETVS